MAGAADLCLLRDTAVELRGQFYSMAGSDGFGKGPIELLI